MKGFALFELILVLGISAWMLTLTIGSLALIQKLPEKYQAWGLYQHLHYARALAIAQDQDTTLSVSGHSLVIQPGGQKFQVTDPSFLSLNVPKVGFKSSGRSQFSGTLTLHTPSLDQALTVDVGHGKITLK